MLRLGAINAISQNDRLRGLEHFCSQLCSRVGVQNSYPPRSGLCMANDGLGTKKAEAPLTFEEKLCAASLPPKFNVNFQTPKNQKLRSLKKESQFVESKKSPLRKESKSVNNKFVPIQRGVWRCILCLEKCNDLPSGTWKGDNSPPASYTEWHDWECHRDNMPVELPEKKPRSITPNTMLQSATCDIIVSNAAVTSDYRGAKCDPVVSSAAATKDYSNAKCDTIVSNAFVPSSKTFDSNDSSGISHDYSQARCDPVLSNNEIKQHNNPDTKRDPETRSDPVPSRSVTILPNVENMVSSKECEVSILVTAEDTELVTPFTAFVMAQLEPCRMNPESEHSNKYRNQKIPISFPGIRCKHCVGQKGCREFFWTCVDRFKNNSSELWKHVLKCQYCPEEIKQRLTTLKLFHPVHMKEKPKGGQILYYRRMFNRLHKGTSFDRRSFSPPPQMPSLSSGNNMNRQHRDSPTLASPPVSPGRKNDGNVSNALVPSLSSSPAVNLSGEENGNFSTNDLNPLMINASASRKYNDKCDLVEDHCPITLGIDEDSDWLEADECTLRRNIEVFCLSVEDLETIKSFPQSMQDCFTLDGSKTNVGQVGLRCLCCSKNQLCKGLSDPFAFKMLSNLDEIRDKCRLLQKHINVCPNATEECKSACENKIPPSTLKIIRKYYNDAARKLGMYKEGGVIKLAHSENKSAPELPIPLATLDVSLPDALLDETMKEQSNEVTPTSYAGGKRTFAML